MQPSLWAGRRAPLPVFAAKGLQSREVLLQGHWVGNSGVLPQVGKEPRRAGYHVPAYPQKRRRGHGERIVAVQRRSAAVPVLLHQRTRGPLYLQSVRERRSI